MIQFFTEGIDFAVPRPIVTKRWLKQVAQEENCLLNALSYIFCSDQYLLQLNVDYLNHDTLTDVITFDYSGDDTQLEGEVYISIDRIRENAKELGVDVDTELRRVMVHGLLHLIGFTDKDSTSKALMTGKEDFYLTRYSSK